MQFVGKACMTDIKTAKKSTLFLSFFKYLKLIFNSDKTILSQPRQVFGTK